MPTSKKEVLQTFALFFVITALSYCLWDYVHGYNRRPALIPMPFLRTYGQSSLLSTDVQEQNRTFIILDYVGYTLNAKDGFTIGNCLVTQDKNQIENADAVVFATRKLKSKSILPKVRHPWQRWVWFLDESPYHPIDGQPFRLSDFNYVYNWTMTYTSDSDIYCPYGWTTRKEKPSAKIPELGKRDRLIAAAISNCGSAYVHNHRMEYLQELHKTAKVTLYGRCGQVCAGYKNNRQDEPCPEIKKFMFYLSFENANCKEYITEKFFGNAFHMGAVPIVLGAKKEEYARVAPPNSFIHVKDFASPQKLGEYVLSLSKNLTAYMEYHKWRKEYSTEYRVQFLGERTWKPLCDKLNMDIGKTKIVPSLQDFWKVSDCDGTKFW